MESFRARSTATTPSAPYAGGGAERLIWIDWLKVIVVSGVFVFHAAAPFLIIDWVVSNDERSMGLSAVAGFGFLFGMPLMFLLTGATTWLSLGRRSLSAYGLVRVRRLLLPLIAGIAILTPLQWWLAAAIARGGENPLTTIAWFFGGMRFEPTSRWFGDYGLHLWFIAFLLAYSLLCLPLLGVLRRPAGARALDWLAGLPTAALLLVLFVPMLVSQWLLRIPSPQYRDWADFVLWLGFFAAGVFLLADRRLLDAVVRSGPRLMLIGIALVVVGLIGHGLAVSSGLIPGDLWSGVIRLESAPALDAPTVAYITLRTAACAALTAGCLWIGVHRFRSHPSWLPRASRAILPFYVLHHPVVVAVAALVVQWPAGPWTKLVVVLVAALAGSVMLTALVMRSSVGRSVFGIPPEPEELSRYGATPASTAQSDPFAVHIGEPLSLDAADRHTSVVGALEQTVRRLPDAEAIRWKEAGSWRRMSYSQLWSRIRAASLGLQLRGIGHGEHVVIVSRSRPEWVVADFAALALGAVVCPIDPGESDARIEQVVRGLRPRLTFVEDERQLMRLGDIAPTVILGGVAQPRSHLVTLHDLERLGGGLGTSMSERWEAAVDRLDRSQAATIVQTIDDAGTSRGAILTHGNVLHNVEAARRELALRPGDVALSILPLSHMFERAAQLVAFTNGATIAFAEPRIDRWSDNMREVRPHAMAVVPLFLTHLVEGMRRGSVGRPGQIGRLARWSIATGASVRGQSGRAGRRRSWLRFALADLLVLRSLRAATGGRLRYVCCGGAPLPVDVAEFLSAAGIPIIEGYGMTEASPLLAMNRLGRQRLGTVGPPVAGTELRIDHQTGEILARGPQVMRGYHDLPRQTGAALLPDGWLRTGDLGAWDADGNLQITGVRKDLLVLASGKKVSPRPIELELESSELIARAAIVDLGAEGIGVLLWPEGDIVRSRAAIDGADVQDPLIAEVRRQLGTRASYERPRRLGILPRDLTAEAGELDSAGRPVRASVVAHWASVATIPLTWRSRELARVPVIPSRVGAVSSAG
ncbi:MAG TPA: AMP-binding protein [Candidatus Limnocylindria bacterium]|nr:AMP-binding protein [Candidatus Limnocylindria bacterium]